MVYKVRQKCGEQLAREANVDADIVSTVPESATPAALGYSKVVCLIAYCLHRCGINKRTQLMQCLSLKVQ